VAETVRHRSSYIDSTTYDADLSVLYVTFSDGSEWRYNDVPVETYRRFLNAPSRGSAFHALIRNSYEGEEV
jgi:hypothetical protein